MKKGYLIYNPTAGQKQKSPEVIEAVLRQFTAYDIEMHPSPTQPGGTVIEQVRGLLDQSPDMLVAWGGDGTINETVNGMFGTNIPLGILPGGTANLCVRELKIPLTVPAAIDLIAKGNTREISVGQANGRYFLLMVGIGFDSAVINGVDPNLKRRFGKLAFSLSALQTARRYHYPGFRVCIDGGEKECVFAVVANAREYGAYFQLTPEADMSDEYFRVCLFKEPGFWNTAKYVWHALRGAHTKLPSVEIIQAKELEILGPEGVAVQADGDVIGYLPMKFKIHPRSLRVFSPEKTL